MLSILKITNPTVTTNIVYRWEKYLCFSRTSLNPKRSIMQNIPCQSPHMRKFQLAPCHIPVAANTINKFNNVLMFPLRFPPSGIYKYSLNQVPKDICHLLQNSFILFEIYGILKFSGKSNPNILPNPIAISE